jgi:hypothetical protein
MMAWPPLSSVSTRSSLSVSVNPAISSGSDHSTFVTTKSGRGRSYFSIQCAAMLAMRAVSAAASAGGSRRQRAGGSAGKALATAVWTCPRIAVSSQSCSAAWSPTSRQNAAIVA